MTLSDKEQKLLDFLKTKEVNVTVEVIEKELGKEYVGALGKLIRNELIKTEKRTVDCPSNPNGIRLVKHFGIKKETGE